MQRRHFVLAAPLAVAGCQTPPSVSSWAQYASALAGGLANAADSVAGIIGLSSDTATTIKTDLKQIIGLTTVIGKVTDPKQAQPLAIQVEQILNAAVAAAAGVALIASTPVGIGLAAAEVVLPLLEAEINQALGIATAPTARRSRLIPTMTPEAGLAYLKASAARK